MSDSVCAYLGPVKLFNSTFAVPLMIFWYVFEASMEVLESARYGPVGKRRGIEELFKFDRSIPLVMSIACSTGL